MKHPYLTEDHDIFRRSVRRFLEKEAEPVYEQWEEERMIPRSFWEKLGEQGFLCPTVEEKYGGGLNLDSVVTAIKDAGGSVEFNQY